MAPISGPRSCGTHQQATAEVLSSPHFDVDHFGTDHKLPVGTHLDYQTLTTLAFDRPALPSMPALFRVADAAVPPSDLASTYRAQLTTVSMSRGSQKITWQQASKAYVDALRHGDRAEALRHFGDMTQLLLRVTQLADLHETEERVVEAARRGISVPASAHTDRRHVVPLFNAEQLAEHALRRVQAERAFAVQWIEGEVLEVKQCSATSGHGVELASLGLVPLPERPDDSATLDNFEWEVLGTAYEGAKVPRAAGRAFQQAEGLAPSPALQDLYFLRAYQQLPPVERAEAYPGFDARRRALPERLAQARRDGDTELAAWRTLYHMYWETAYQLSTQPVTDLRTGDHIGGVPAPHLLESERHAVIAQLVGDPAPDANADDFLDHVFDFSSVWRPYVPALTPEDLGQGELATLETEFIVGNARRELQRWVGPAGVLVRRKHQGSVDAARADWGDEVVGHYRALATLRERLQAKGQWSEGAENSYGAATWLVYVDGLRAVDRPEAAISAFHCGPDHSHPTLNNSELPIIAQRHRVLQAEAPHLYDDAGKVRSVDAIDMSEEEAGDLAASNLFWERAAFDTNTRNDLYPTGGGLAGAIACSPGGPLAMAICGGIGALFGEGANMATAYTNSSTDRAAVARLGLSASSEAQAETYRSAVGWRFFGSGVTGTASGALLGYLPGGQAVATTLRGFALQAIPRTLAAGRAIAAATPELAARAAAGLGQAMANVATRAEVLRVAAATQAETAISGALGTWGRFAARTQAWLESFVSYRFAHATVQLGAEALPEISTTELATRAGLLLKTAAEHAVDVRNIAARQGLRLIGGLSAEGQWVGWRTYWTQELARRAPEVGLGVAIGSMVEQEPGDVSRTDWYGVVGAAAAFSGYLRRLGFKLGFSIVAPIATAIIDSAQQVAAGRDWDKVDFDKVVAFQGLGFLYQVTGRFLIGRPGEANSGILSGRIPEFQSWESASTGLRLRVLGWQHGITASIFIGASVPFTWISDTDPDSTVLFMAAKHGLTSIGRHWMNNGLGYGSFRQLIGNYLYNWGETALWTYIGLNPHESVSDDEPVCVDAARVHSTPIGVGGFPHGMLPSPECQEILRQHTEDRQGLGGLPSLDF